MLGGKTLFKAAAAVTALSMLTASFAGCEKAKKTGKEENGKVSISICAWPNKDASPEKYARREEQKERFNKLYPDIEIIPDEWVFDVKTFLPKAEGGTLPTLYPTYFTEGKKIMDLGYAADITKEFKKYGYYDKMNDFVLENISRDGKIYLIPRSIYTLGLVVNMDIFREAGLVNEDDSPQIPDTFDELIETARTITEKTGKAGFVLPTTENAGGWIFTVLVWNFGTKFMEEKDGKWISTFDSDECASALEYIKDLKWKYNVLPSNTLVNNAEVRKLLGTGQAAMTISGIDAADAMVQQYGTKAESIGMGKMPAGKSKRISLMGGGYYALRNDATEAQKDAVFKWIEFDGIGAELTDDLKKTLETNVQTRLTDGKIVGVNDYSYWNGESKIQEYKEELNKKYMNVPESHVASYNDKTDIEFQFEEPVCAQDLYALLDSCIQKVLTDKNADCRALVKEASKKFQTNYLDYEN